MPNTQTASDCVIAQVVRRSNPCGTSVINPHDKSGYSDIGITRQSRALEGMYPVVFFDCLWVKIREEAVVRNKAVHLALGVLSDGSRDILGLWIENTEGVKLNLSPGNGGQEVKISSPLGGFSHATNFPSLLYR
jgi:hypothetical protein